ncbi:MAG: tetratricopeptide repeat protein [Bacteroidetes bacterium]|nr:tetratricopeptide repeat protein [Bacteroidota bacterium]
MNRKARTTIIGLLLLIALVIGACQQASTQTKEELAETKSESEDTSLTPEEQYDLALAYYHGKGVLKDWNQEIHWYRKAAMQGHAAAQAALGNAYYRGRGVLKDWNQATHWWRKAAEQGDAEAQLMLGLAYENGWGVEQDFTEAYAWFIITQATGGETEEGNEDIRDFTSRIESELTPAQIKRGQQRAKELHEQIQANIAKRDQAN